MPPQPFDTSAINLIRWLPKNGMVPFPTNEPRPLTFKIPARILIFDERGGRVRERPSERAFSDGLTDTKHYACLLPASFGVIQIVEDKYKKERKHREAELEAKEAARRQRWFGDAVDEVQLGVKEF